MPVLGSKGTVAGKPIEEIVKKFKTEISNQRMRIINTIPVLGHFLIYVKTFVDESGFGNDRPVAYLTNDGEMYINPVVMYKNGFTKKADLATFIAHEAMHQMLIHVYRGRGRNEFLWNIASDIVADANLVLLAGNKFDSIFSQSALMGQSSDFMKVIFDKYISMAKSYERNGESAKILSVEDIYNELIEMAKNAKKNGQQGSCPLPSEMNTPNSNFIVPPQSNNSNNNQNSQNSKGSGSQNQNQTQSNRPSQCSNTSCPFRNKDGSCGLPANNVARDLQPNVGGMENSETANARSASEWLNRTREAVEEAKRRQRNEAKNQGSIFAGVDETIAVNIEPPIINWKIRLRNMFGHEFNDYQSYAAPSRRLAVARRIGDRIGRRFTLPGFMKKGRPFIAVTIDTSGSISEGELEEFLNEIYNLAKKYDIKILLINADVEVGRVELFNKPHEFKRKISTGIKITGRGGTSFVDACKFVDNDVPSKYKDKPQMHIYFTDGYGDFPRSTKTRMIWVVDNHDADVPIQHNSNWDVIRYDSRDLPNL